MAGHICESFCQHQLQAIKSTFKYFKYFALTLGIILTFMMFYTSEDIQTMPIRQIKENTDSANFPIRQIKDSRSTDSATFPFRQIKESEDSVKSPFRQVKETKVSANRPFRQIKKSKDSAKFPFRQMKENTDFANFPLRQITYTANFPIRQINESTNAKLLAAKLSSKHYVPYPHAEKVTSKHVIDSETLRILFWTKWSSKTWWFLPDTSMVSCGGLKCQYTHDKSLADVSDALLFFVRKKNYVKENATIQSAHPKSRNPKQYWVGHFQGPPSYGDFDDLDKLNNMYNLSSSYHHEADVRTRYGYCHELNSSETLGSNYARGKTGLVSWFVSHCDTENGRKDFVIKLKEHIEVHVYGGCTDEQLESLGKQCETNKANKRNCNDARDTMNSHKFYLAFENTNCVDYITEKVYKILEPHMTTVPIIMSGVDNLQNILPPKSYIDVNDFSSAKKLAEYLLRLDRNDDLYNEYFAWRSSYRCILNWIPCSFCESFHGVYGRQNTLFTDTRAIFGKEENCEKPVSYDVI